MVAAAFSVTAFTSTKSSAQCFPVTPATYFPMNSSDVLNTGVDVQRTFSPNGELIAAVWDGSNPGIGTYLYGTVIDGPHAIPIAGSSQGLTVIDPDVVIVPEITNLVLVVYQGIDASGASNIYYEIWDRPVLTSAQLGAGPIVGPKTVSSSPSGRERNPNVDVDYGGVASIVWEDYGSNQILIQLIDLIGGMPYIPFGFLNDYSASIPAGTVSDPDISIFQDPMTGNNQIHLVYKRVLSGFDYIDVCFYTINDIVNLGTAAPNPDYISSIVPNPVFLNKPRIAAGYVNPSDHIITYERYDGNTGTYYILSDGYENGIPIGLTVKNANFSEIQSLPVVSYGGDLAMIMWEYDDANTAIYSSVNEIHGQITFWDLTNFVPCFSLLEFPNTTSNTIPSIAGRAVGGNMCHVWYDEVNREIGFKSNSSSNPNIRRGRVQVDGGNSTTSAETKELLIYPNPTQGVLYFSNIMPGTEYIMTSMHGSIVQRGTFNSADTQLNMENLNTGVYLLKLHSDKLSTTTRIVKH